jgi:hypothetical protein
MLLHDLTSAAEEVEDIVTWKIGWQDGGVKT